MNTIQEIKRRIHRVIEIERGITQREIDEYNQKKHDQEAVFGLGGFYDRYEKCIEKRQAHLDELEAIDKQAGSALLTETLVLYPFWCPTCQLEILLRGSQCRHTLEGDVIDCPICSRTLWRSARSRHWEVVKGSEKVEVSR